MKRFLFLIMILFLLSGCILKKEKIPNIYDVNFIVDGVIVQTLQIKEGEDAVAPDDPTKEGYEFVGWDKAFTNIQSNTDINAIFEIAKVSYKVRFYNEGILINSQDVIEGEKAIAPEDPIKEGYLFVGWNKNFDGINEDLEVSAIFMKNTLDNIVSYTSYVSSLSYNEASSYESLLENFDYYNNLKGTIPEIVYGGFRETNKIHYYDKTNIRDRNRFGFEVAIDENNVVIEKAVLVNLPTNGAILSGHGEGATTLGDLIKVGDVIIYEANKVDYFRQKGVSEVFDLYFKINRIKELINSSYEDLKALNYQLILEKTNQLINLYNGLISSYSETEYQAALALYMDVSFLSIEETSSMVKAYWHYPTRCIGYMENNVASIAALLDEVARMGLNRIYLNTNYGGYAVYKSSILTQRLTTYYKYAGYKDYLECFISLAHARGIEVYAWTNTLIAGDGEPNPYYSVRNWLNIFYDGSSNYSGMHYIDIANVDKGSSFRCF